MKKVGNLFRLILYKSLSFKNYLFVLSKLYFVYYNLGLLKNNKFYQYPYFLKNIINRGDVVIDIGANLGYYTVILSNLVKKEGKVYAVEPIKPILSVLKKNTKNKKNVKILPYALGNENKEIVLGNDTKAKTGFIASGSNYVIDKNTSGKDFAEVKFEAEMRKGSELFKNLKKLDFIKIDVEGYETVVLPEMEHVIDRFKPIILAESRQEKRKELISFLGEKKYTPYVLEDNYLKFTVQNAFWDILFVPEVRQETISRFIRKPFQEKND
jgi:FkbM family methyltransferase